MWLGLRVKTIYIRRGCVRCGQKTDPINPDF
jgi:cbb3-type cytochrome oxidase cytochrome c subunit